MEVPVSEDEIYGIMSLDTAAKVWSVRISARYTHHKKQPLMERERE
jgi:hypothetical protein